MRLLVVLMVLSLPVFAEEATWRTVTSGTTESLTGVSFGDSSTGVATGTNGTVLRTVDGGLKWSAVGGLSLNPLLCCSQVRFWNSSVVWLIGSGTRLRSGNGGSSWFGVIENDPYVRRALAPVSSEKTWYVGNSLSAGWYLWYWKQHGSSSNSWAFGQAATDTMYRLDFVDADNGWAAGSPGRIVRITGASAMPKFTTQTTGTTAALRGIDMVDADNGWAVGDGGTILRTANGGATWTAQNSGVVNGLRAVSFRNLSEGFVVGTAGLILSTMDGGATWTPESIGVSVDLASVFNGDRTIAVGANGTIVRRTLTAGGCDYSFSPRYVMLGSEGGSGNFSVNHPNGCAWTATSAASWITLTAGSGGDGSVAFTVARNTAEAGRDGAIQVGSDTFTVTQYGTSGRCPYTVSPAAMSFLNSGGKATVTVSTLNACEWAFSDNASLWVSVDPPYDRVGSGSFTVAVSPNASGADRTGIVFVLGTSTYNHVPPLPAIQIAITQSAEGLTKRRAARH